MNISQIPKGYERFLWEDFQVSPPAPPAKKAIYQHDGMMLWRQPTAVELQIDLKAIQTAFDQGEQDLEKQLETLRNKILDDAVAGIILLEPADYHKLYVTPDKKDIAKLRDQLQAIYDKGRKLVIQELEDQGATDLNSIFDITEEDDAELDTLSAVTTSRLANDVQSRVIGIAAAAVAVGIVGALLKDRILQAFRDLSNAYIGNAAATADHVALNIGRDAAAVANIGQIKEVYYSSVLDQNTCIPCQDADGETGADAADIPAAPNPECDGRGRCRCIHVYVYKSEQPKSFPNHAGRPGLVGGSMPRDGGSGNILGSATQDIQELLRGWTEGDYDWKDMQHAAGAVISGLPIEKYVCYDCRGDDATRYENAQKILALIQSQKVDKPLYRGLSKVEAGKFRVGKVFSESLTSWTGDQKLAMEFANGEHGGSFFSTGRTSAVMLIKGNNMRGVNISQFSDKEPFKSADEYLTSGEYRVESNQPFGAYRIITVVRIGNAKANDLRKSIKGGLGSGNFGHAGRPGLVGGSGPAASHQNTKFIFEGVVTNESDFDLQVGEIFGDKVSTKDLQDSMWATSDAAHVEMDLRKNVRRNTSILTTKVWHDDYIASSTIVYDHNNNISQIEDHLLSVLPDRQGHGIGSRLMKLQALAAKQIGVKQITLLAVRDDETKTIGYRVWPKLGFDTNFADQSGSIQRLIAKSPFSDVKTMSELYATKAGRDWWSQHGTDIVLSFDPSDNSNSLSILNKYISEASKRHHHSATVGQKDQQLPMPDTAIEPDLFEGGEVELDDILYGDDNQAKGGEGSGNFGHEGRPGLVGGSAASGVTRAQENHALGKSRRVGQFVANATQAHIGNDFFEYGNSLRNNKAIVSYKNYGYKAIGELLRHNSVPDGILMPDDKTNFDEQSAKNLVAELDTLFREAPALTKGAVIWTGVTSENAKALVTAKSDDVISDSSFRSATMNPSIATRFAKAWSDTKTDRAAVVRIVSDGKMKAIGGFNKAEAEILLNRGQNFKVLANEIINSKVLYKEGVARQYGDAMHKVKLNVITVTPT